MSLDACLSQRYSSRFNDSQQLPSADAFPAFDVLSSIGHASMHELMMPVKYASLLLLRCSMPMPAAGTR